MRRTKRAAISRNPRHPATAHKALRQSPSAQVVVQYRVMRRGLPSAVSLRRYVAAAGGADGCITVRFVDAREGRALNRRYAGKDHATNVLSFPYQQAPQLQGDVVLCAPVLRAEARTQGKPLKAHCAHLVVHGVLHLRGHDHQSNDEAQAMEAREVAILQLLGFANPYL